MQLRKNERTADDFWREYEEKTGEKVLARSLGQYFSGWAEFNTLQNIWGLVIFTSGGFRFHHFPQQSWLNSIFRSGSSEGPKEKTIFIPNEKIKNFRLIEETKWWKKIFSSIWQQLIIRYEDESGVEQQLFMEADFKSKDLAHLTLVDKAATAAPSKDACSTGDIQ